MDIGQNRVRRSVLSFLGRYVRDSVLRCLGTWPGSALRFLCHKTPPEHQSWPQVGSVLWALTNAPLSPQGQKGTQVWPLISFLPAESPIGLSMLKTLGLCLKIIYPAHFPLYNEDGRLPDREQKPGPCSLTPWGPPGADVITL